MADLHIHRVGNDDVEVPADAKARLLDCVLALPALNATFGATSAALAWVSETLAPVSRSSPPALALHVNVEQSHSAVQPACEPGVSLSETMQAATSTLAFDLDLLVAGMPAFDGLSVRLCAASLYPARNALARPGDRACAGCYVGCSHSTEPGVAGLHSAVCRR